MPKSIMFPVGAECIVENNKIMPESVKIFYAKIETREQRIALVDYLCQAFNGVHTILDDGKPRYYRLSDEEIEANMAAIEAREAAEEAAELAKGEN